MADIHEEGRHLIAQAKALQQQWMDARTRMECAQRDIMQRQTPTLHDKLVVPGDGFREERQALAESRLALERELVRSRRLEDEVLAIQDQERARLARDLHDGVCQELAGANFLMAVHRRQPVAQGRDAGSLQTAREIEEVLSRTNQQIRSLAHGSSAIEVGAWGESLCAALAAMAERVNAYEGLPCEAVCAEAPVRGGVPATHLYRIAQEAVGNAVRHGRAQRIGIRFAREGGQWRLSVEDDGIGVPEGGLSGSGGLGLRSMEYRAAVLGGVLEVRRAAAAVQRPGTLVRRTFP